MLSHTAGRGGRSGGFSLLETIVAVVVLGIIGAFAIPTGAHLVERSHDSAAKLTMSHALHEVLGLPVYRGDGTFRHEDFSRLDGTEASFSASLGTFASGVPLFFVKGPSTRYGQVSYAISGSNGSAGLAMRSQTSRCVYGVAHADGGITSVTEPVSVERCTGQAAGEVVAKWDPIASPAAGSVSAREDSPTSWDFSVLPAHRLQVSDSATGPFADSATVTGIGSFSVPASAGASVSFVPVADAYGPFSLFIRSLSESGDYSRSVEVVGTLEPVNDVPVANPTLTVVRANEGASDVPADMDGADPSDQGRLGYPSGSPVAAYEVVAVPSSGTVRLDRDPGPLAEWVTARPGMVTSNPELRFTPPAGVTGSFSASYRVADVGYPAPALLSAPANVTWTFKDQDAPAGTSSPDSGGTSGTGTNTAPAAPTGSLPTVPERVQSADTFTTVDPDPDSSTFQTSADSAKGFDDSLLHITGKGWVSVTDTDRTDRSVRVVFKPADGFAGEASFWLRVDDGAGAVSPSTLVTVNVTCDPTLTHSYASPCETTAGKSLIAESFDASQQTTVRGDVLVSGPVTTSNDTTLSADISGAGRGALTGGTVNISSGSNAYVNGDVWLHGSLSTNALQSHFGGDVRLHAGSFTVGKNKKSHVDGSLTVNSPHTITGGVTATKGAVVAPAGTVPAPDRPTLPVVDLTNQTFEHTFATWADLRTWLAGNRTQLGTAGRSTLRVTQRNTTSENLDLTGTVSGHLLLVAEGPVTVQAWPSATTGSSFTLVSTSTSTSKTDPALKVAVSASSSENATTTLYSAGALEFTNQSVLYGQVIAKEVRVRNNTEVSGRLPAHHASRIIFGSGRKYG